MPQMDMKWQDTFIYLLHFYGTISPTRCLWVTLCGFFSIKMDLPLAEWVADNEPRVGEGAFCQVLWYGYATSVLDHQAELPCTMWWHLCGWLLFKRSYSFWKWKVGRQKLLAWWNVVWIFRREEGHSRGAKDRKA